MNALRQRRHKLGLSLKDVGKRTGLSSSGVQAIEVGDRPTPLDESVRRLAPVYKMTPSEFRAAIPSGKEPKQITIDAETHERLVLLSRDRGWSVRETVENALDRMIGRKRREASAAYMRQPSVTPCGTTAEASG